MATVASSNRVFQETTSTAFWSARCAFLVGSSIYVVSIGAGPLIQVHKSDTGTLNFSAQDSSNGPVPGGTTRPWSAAYDGSRYIHVAYNSGSTAVTHVRFDTQTDTWTTGYGNTPTTMNYDRNIRISINSSGNPQIAYCAYADDADLSYYVWDGDSWEGGAAALHAVSSSEASTMADSIDNGSGNTVHVFYDTASDDMTAGTFSGTTATVVDLDASVPASETNHSAGGCFIPFNDGGTMKATVAYIDADLTLKENVVSLDTNPITASQIASQVAIHSTADDIGLRTPLATARYNGTDYVVWWDDASSGTIYVKTKTAGTWSSTPTAFATGVSRPVALLPIGTTGGLLIIYQNTTTTVACDYLVQPAAPDATGATSPDAIALEGRSVSGWDGNVASYSEAVMALNPVGYWRLGESSGTTAYDETANSFDGTHNGTPTIGETGLLVGDANTSYLFDGVDDRITIAHDAALTMLGDFTISVIALPTSLTGIDKGLFIKAGSATTVADMEYGLSMTTDDRWSGWVAIGSTRYVATATDVVPSLTVPTHLVLRRSGTTLSLFVNAVKYDTTGVTGDANAVSETLAIGTWGSSTTTTRRFNGVVDEAAVWATDLSDGDVATLYAWSIGDGGGNEVGITSPDAITANGRAVWGSDGNAIIVTLPDTVTATGRSVRGTSIFTVTDAFTDTDGTTLASHTASGITWTRHPSYTASTMQIDANGAHHQTASSGDVTLYYASTDLGDADYDISAPFTIVSDNNTSQVGVAARIVNNADTFYFVVYDSSQNEFRIGMRVNGTTTDWGAFNPSTTPVGSGTIGIRVIGNVVYGLWNGNVVLCWDDATASIPAQGYGGVYAMGVGSSSSGIRLDAWTLTTDIPTVDVGTFAPANTLHVISDTHLGSIIDVRKNDLADTLTTLSIPDHAALRVHTGDLISDGSESIANAKAFMDAGGTPWRISYGNHDLWRSLATNVAGYGQAGDWYVDVGDYIRVIGVTMPTNAVPLTLSQTTLDWLDARLDETSRTCVIATHPPLYGTHDHPTDYQIEPQASIATILADHPHVKVWLSGHVHRCIMDPEAIDLITVGGNDILCLASSGIHYTRDDPGTALRPAQLNASHVLTFVDDTLELRIINHVTGEWLSRNDEPVTIFTLGTSTTATTSPDALTIVGTSASGIATSDVNATGTTSPDAFTVTGVAVKGEQYAPTWTASRTIQVISDIHTGEIAPYDLAVAAADINATESWTSLLVSTGDQVDNALANAEFAAWRASVRDDYAFIAGNHDVDGQSITQWETYYGVDRNWYVDIGSTVRVIGISVVDTLDPSTLSQESLDYLDATLAATTRNCVVAFHKPYPGTLNSSQSVGCMQPKAAIDAIIARRPQWRVWVSGHTHANWTTGPATVTVGDRTITVATSGDLWDVAYDPITTMFVELRETSAMIVWRDMNAGTFLVEGGVIEQTFAYPLISWGITSPATVTLTERAVVGETFGGADGVTSPDALAVSGTSVSAIVTNAGDRTGVTSPDAITIVGTTVSGTGAIGISDAFTDADSTQLVSHTSTSGHAWYRHLGGGYYFAIASNTVYNTGSTTATHYIDATPPSANYDVGLDFTVHTAASGIGVVARLDSAANTMYRLYYSGTAGTFRIARVVEGASSFIGSTYTPDPPIASGRMVLRVDGSTLTAFLDGEQIIQVVDASITDAGYGGLYAYGASSTTTGVVGDNFALTPFDAPGSATTSPDALALEGRSVSGGFSALGWTTRDTASIAGKAVTASFVDTIDATGSTTPDALVVASIAVTASAERNESGSTSPDALTLSGTSATGYAGIIIDADGTTSASGITVTPNLAGALVSSLGATSHDALTVSEMTVVAMYVAHQTGATSPSSLDALGRNTLGRTLVGMPWPRTAIVDAVSGPASSVVAVPHMSATVSSVVDGPATAIDGVPTPTGIVTAVPSIHTVWEVVPDGPATSIAQLHFPDEEI